MFAMTPDSIIAKARADAKPERPAVRAALLNEAGERMNVILVHLDDNGAVSGYAPPDGHTLVIENET